MEMHFAAASLVQDGYSRELGSSTSHASAPIPSGCHLCMWISVSTAYAESANDDKDHKEKVPGVTLYPPPSVP